MVWAPETALPWDEATRLRPRFGDVPVILRAARPISWTLSSGQIEPIFWPRGQRWAGVLVELPAGLGVFRAKALSGITGAVAKCFRSYYG